MEDKKNPPFPPPPPNIGAKMKDDVKNNAPAGGVSFPLPPKPPQGNATEKKEMPAIPKMAPPQFKNADASETMVSEQDAEKKKPIDKVKVLSISGVTFGGLLLIACLVLVFVI